MIWTKTLPGKELIFKTIVKFYSKNFISTLEATENLGDLKILNQISSYSYKHHQHGILYYDATALSYQSAFMSSRTSVSFLINGHQHARLYDGPHGKSCGYLVDSCNPPLLYHDYPQGCNHDSNHSAWSLSGTASTYTQVAHPHTISVHDEGQLLLKFAMTENWKKSPK